MTSFWNDSPKNNTEIPNSGQAVNLAVCLKASLSSPINLQVDHNNENWFSPLPLLFLSAVDRGTCFVAAT
jgi:hypothetical protein